MKNYRGRYPEEGETREEMCERCGHVGLQESDGFYYCQFCGAQSPDMIVTLLQNHFYIAPDGRRRRIYSPAPPSDDVARNYIDDAVEPKLEDCPSPSSSAPAIPFKPPRQRRKDRDLTSGMAQSEECLELISVGSLYAGGPWEKKYWSCSRGKERYPYPVGYHARRAHCQLEIREGPQGPLFVITRADGELCSGQTPQIAWNKFQRKGKRFSCKANDGIEFFGFKSPFVQRLLRELLANMAECCTPGSALCIDNLVVEQKAQRMQSGRQPEGTRKKCSQRLRGDKLGKSRVPPLELNVLPVKDISFENSVSNSSLGNQTPEQATDASSESRICDSPYAVAAARGKLLVDKSQQGIEMEEGSCSKLFVEESAPSSVDFQRIKGIGLYVPDSLDFAQDSAPDPIDKDNCAHVNESTSYSEAVFGGLVAESHQDEIVATSNSYSSEFESLGHDIAKSMMSLLLPQAVPLLKEETSRKKRKLPRLFQNPGVSLKSVEKTPCERGQCTDYQSVGAHHHTIPDSQLVKSDSFEKRYFDHVVNKHRGDDERGQCTDSQSVEKASNSISTDFELVKYFIYDSSDDQCSDHLVNHSGMWPSNREDTQPCCNNEGDKSKDIYCVDEEKPALVEQPPPVAGLAAKQRADSNSSIPNKAIATRNATLGDEATSDQSSEKDISTEITMNKVPKRVFTRRKYNAPLSKSVICRHFGEDNLQGLTGTCPDSAAFPSRSSDNNLVNLESGYFQQYSDGCNAKPNHLLDCATPFSMDEYNRNSDHLSFRNGGPKYQSDDKDAVDVGGPTLPDGPETLFCITKPLGRVDTAANSGVLLNRNVWLNNELNGYHEFVGCYFHPVKVSSLLLRTDGTHIFICALCGVSNESCRTLFLYKLALEKPRIGVPSFVGQTLITLPSYKDALGGIAHERCCLQLTPDGLSVAMLGSIRAPCCREQRTDCLCQICTTDGFDFSSVKIVQVKCGYVSILIKLTTVNNPRCLLVCGLNHLAVSGEGGGLHVWAMNLAWSAAIEEFCIPADYERCYSTVELKEIPKSGSLVVGHNGVGEFLVWDISRRILLSRFSAPTTWISEFSVIGVFGWSREVPDFSYLVAEDKIKQIVEATRFQLSEQCRNTAFYKEDVAIWLLVSTASCVDDAHISNDPQRRHQWRLALLAKSMLIFGDEFDPRAAAIGASGCNGLIGTSDGLVYAWNLLSGSQLGTLHHFKGGSVSCIATESGVLAVADATGQLMVYQNSEPCAY